jgi:hypothetical protein
MLCVMPLVVGREPDSLIHGTRLDGSMSPDLLLVPCFYLQQSAGSAVPLIESGRVCLLMHAGLCAGKYSEIGIADPSACVACGAGERWV